MADEASWDSKRGRSSRASSSATTAAAAAAAPAPTTSGRRATSSQRGAFEGKDFRGRTRSRGLARKWGALSRWLLQTRHWAEQDPTLLALRAALVRLLDNLQPLYARLRCKADSVAERCWPRLEKWGTFIGRLLLVMGIAMLDCSVRGVKSIFRLSSAAICLILWCCLVNLTVLAGFLSVSIAAVVGALVSFFLGLLPGFCLIVLYGAVVLWKYGSFWTTLVVVAVAALLFFFDRGRVPSGFILLLYTAYSSKVRAGWLGLTLCVCLAFISSDLVIHYITSIEERRQREKLHEQYGRSNFSSAPKSQTARTNPEDENGPSVSGAPDVDQTVSEEEVARVLGCSDHYAVLGLPRFENCDEMILKREYRKKAMLVHPDKNQGNVRAEEAFKRLQNAYEVLLDIAKKKCYDDDLRREQLIENFRRNGFGFHKNGRCESPDCACRNYQQQADGEAELIDGRPIVCRNCKQLHMWTPTDRNKQHARWCQECQEFHPAKDGDGWVEQSGQSFFFGLFQKVDLPQAYACAGSLVYNVTEWAICQGMKCPANTHKPSFFVSTASQSSNSSSRSKGSRRANVAEGFPFPDIEENMSEQEFYEWLERAMASGLFDLNSSAGKQSSSSAAAAAANSGATSNQSSTKSNRKKKRGGKKQW